MEPKQDAPSVEMFDRVEHSIARQEVWEIKEAVVRASTGEITIKELQRQLVESWQSDQDRVAVGLGISRREAADLLDKATRDPEACAQVARFQPGGRVKKFNNGNPLPFHTHPHIRFPHLVTEIATMKQEIERHEKNLVDEADRLEPEEMAFKRHELEQFIQFASDEGLRISDDMTPWMPCFYDPEITEGLDAAGRAQRFQEAIWAAMIAPPVNERGEYSLSHIMDTIKRMLNGGYSADEPFVNPETLKSDTPLKYAASLAHEAGKRQAAAFQGGLAEECSAAGWEERAMASIINAIFDIGGSFFSDNPTDVARAEKKRAARRARGKCNDPIVKIPRGYNPGYEVLHREVELVGAKEKKHKKKKKL